MPARAIEYHEKKKYYGWPVSRSRIKPSTVRNTERLPLRQPFGLNDSNLILYKLQKANLQTDRLNLKNITSGWNSDFETA